ncbi:MAG: hypothetical protein O2967_11230 [Proteobacteria bacterium]|nr:hypothetical protein [Pseudomonadota bacterium]
MNQASLLRKAALSFANRPAVTFGLNDPLSHGELAARLAIAPRGLPCLDHIARVKRPRASRFIAALPRNNHGKVPKTELRGLLAREEETTA